MSPKSFCAFWIYVVLWIMCPVVSGAGWQTTAAGDFEYSIAPETVRFYHAQAACSNSHAQLVVFATSDQYDDFMRLNALDKGKQYWIGLRQENPAESKIDGWYWIDETYFIHTSNWPKLDVTGNTGEYCARITNSSVNNKRMWRDDLCNQTYSYICMKEIKLTTTTTTTTKPTTTTTAPSTATDTTDPPTTTDPVSNLPSTQETPKPTNSEGVEGATEQEMATTYIGIGAGLGGLVLLLIIVAVIVVAVRRKSTKQKPDKKKQQNSVNHSHSNKAYGDGEDPTYEAEDNGIDPHYQSVDLDTDQVTYTEVETKPSPGAAVATPVDDTYYNTAQVTTSSNPRGRDRDDGVVYSDVETGPRYQNNAAAGGGAKPKPQQQQSPNGQDNDLAAMYASVDKSAKPKTPTALDRNAEASASQDPEAKQPNVPADVDVEEMYAQVNKPPRPDVEPPRPAGNEEEETDYYALAPAIPSKPMELL